MPHKQIHEGRNVKRFREMLGLKQEGLAYKMGDEWSQKRVSALEMRETIDLPVLQLIATALQLPVEAFQNFDEEQAVNIISNTINNHDQSAVIQYNPVFNPIEKWLDALEENKKLYERMLQQQQEMIEQLKQLINK